MAAPAPIPTRVRATLIGVSGRMGQALLRAAPAFPRLNITGAVASPTSLSLGRDAGEVAGVGCLHLPIISDLPRALTEADVAIDFSSAAATRTNLAACRAARKPLLIGTTGLAAELDRALAAAARDIPLLVAANTSLGVTLLLELVRIAARALPPAFDVDILDVHHRSKQDAPSGTALALGAAAREARQMSAAAGGASGAAAAGDGAHRDGEVGFASVRAGDIVGEHTVLFAGPGEALSLTHRATDRGIFARGALAAALWLQSRPPGRYTMGDLLAQKTIT
jgi:4-hydroxy-tetrahydrodipicolinate reductase